VWPRKHRADFDGEIRENLPPEQAQHAVDLLIGCGPESLTYDVLAEGGGIEPILSERASFRDWLADHSARAFRNFDRDGEIRTPGTTRQ